MRGWLLLAAVWMLSGCAADVSSQSVVLTCVLPQDQVGTFDGRWKVSPIPIAVAAGQFSDAEKTVIRQAVQRWNSFTRLSLKRDIFDVGASGMPESSLPRPTSICTSSQPTLLAGQFQAPLVIRKHATWIYPSATSAIAITSTCPLADTPVNQFYSGAMDLNYQNFFVSGKPVPDLQSIIVHELGHMLGLKHSCELSSNQSGVPSCSAANLDPTYKSAVLYPVFGFTNGYGEKRFQLNTNDQGRANCLYQAP